MVLMYSLRSRSYHGQGYLKVTVILKSRSFWNEMVMCFDFCNFFLIFFFKDSGPIRRNEHIEDIKQRKDKVHILFFMEV